MKILIVVTKGEIGGTQMSVLNLAVGLKTLGEDVAVGFGEGEFLQQELPQYHIPLVNFKWLKRTHNPLANLSFIWEIKKLIDRNGYDVVHFNSSNSLFGAIGAKLARPRPKTVFTFRGLSMLDRGYEAGSVLKTIYQIFFKILIKFIDHPIFVSQLNLQYGLEHNIIKKGKVVYNGLDPQRLDFLAPGEARHELGNLALKNLDQNFLIGSIGRLAYPKNYEFLIEQFAEIKKIKNEAILLIIGEGPERKKYENLISELSLEDSVILTGNIHNAARYIKAFDLFVLPSKFEGLSITLIEALFAGIPILTSKVGGSAELLDNNLYQLFEANNKADFLKKFQKLVEPALLSELSETNLLQSKKFTLENTVNGYLKIYSM
jgi:glycosyltransferase involved in cell wall biosynthesis